MILVLLACAGAPDATDDATVPLEPARLARRLSLDLRGVLPSADELDTVAADPDAVWALRDAWLDDDERLTERLVHIYAETWHTRVDIFDIEHWDYGLDRSREYAFERAVGEEPLRILARVATEDLPLGEVTTGDWTMANELLGEIWPVDYPDGGSGWLPVSYTDDRPKAGVLTTNGLWWRYTTTTSNVNRGRAAAISRLLLCEDMLGRPVAFSEADTTSTSTAQAAQSDPYCIACHASLDPLAASLFGFWWLSLYSEIEETTYHPEREALWGTYIGTEPAWFGTPTANLSEVGVEAARDSRLYTCAVETLAEGLWRRQTTQADQATLQALERDFLQGGALLRPLIAAITETENYQAGDGSGPAAAERTERMLTPLQFASAVEDLTGFAWTYEGAAMLDTDAAGYRLLGGGVDGFYIKSPQHDPGLTWALVVERAAQGAASAVVEAELELGESAALLTEVTLDDRPGDAAFDAQLAQLHWRLYAVHADADWVADIEQLWTAVDALDGPAAAWRSVVSVMLRDPAFVAY